MKIVRWRTSDPLPPPLLQQGAWIGGMLFLFLHGGVSILVVFDFEHQSRISFTPSKFYSLRLPCPHCCPVSAFRSFASN